MDLKKKDFVSSHRFEQGSHINEVSQIILGSQYLLGTSKGILHSSRDTLVKHYFEGTKITALCHIRNTLYLVGGRDNLFVWDLQEDKRLKYISTDYICSI